jgi:MoxR-like ATPase
MFFYIAEIIRASRASAQVQLGASPRAAQCLLLCSKAAAALGGRDFITPDDVKYVAFPAMRHRLLLKPEAEIEGTTADQVVSAILSKVQVPR